MGVGSHAGLTHHFAALLTETDAHGAGIVLARLLESAPAGVSGGMGCYPEDGATFDELLEIAKTRGTGADEHAA